jgi:hypothetical protein
MFDHFSMPEWMVETLIAIAGAFLGGLIWGLRLESLVKQSAKDIDRLDSAHAALATKHESLDAKIMEKFSDVVEALARIEERLKSRQERNHQ